MNGMESLQRPLGQSVSDKSAFEQFNLAYSDSQSDPIKYPVIIRVLDVANAVAKKHEYLTFDQAFCLQEMIFYLEEAKMGRHRKSGYAISISN
jgi:hypothetical protein